MAWSDWIILDNSQDKKGGGVGKQWSIFPDFGNDPDFWKKLVQKWPGFASKSPDFTKYWRKNTEN